MTSHLLQNVHTAPVEGIEPGATGDFTDATEWARVRKYFVGAGLMVDPQQINNGFTTDDEDEMANVAYTTEYTTTGAPDTPDLFTVSGGDIEILDLWIKVTTDFSSDASNLKFQCVSDTGPTTTDTCTTVSCASAAAGVYFQNPSAVGSAAVKSAVGLGAVVQGKPTYRMGPGKLRLSLSGNTADGKFVAYVKWRKLDPNASLVAAF